MSIINLKNDAYKEGRYPIFLGQQLGLYDSVNVTYPKMMELYEKQKAQDWHQAEVSLDQTRKDFQSCNKNNYDVMIKTLSWQWEADSVAKSIITLFSPFLTNNEAATMMMKQSEIEVLHALTYSEIVRQCIRDPKEIFNQILENQNISQRMGVVEEILTELDRAGAEYKLGIRTIDDNLRLLLLKGMVALVGLEGIEFLSSFAATFSLAEQDLFMGAAKLIQKIMLDEVLHTHMDMEILTQLLKEPEWARIFEDNKEELKSILDCVVKQEEDWSKYIFSEGRVVLGLNEILLKEWVYYNSAPLYRKLKMKPDFKVPRNNPLPWMDKWLDPDKIQVASQEIQRTDYKVNTAKNDIDDEELDF